MTRSLKGFVNIMGDIVRRADDAPTTRVRLGNNPKGSVLGVDQIGGAYGDPSPINKLEAEYNAYTAGEQSPEYMSYINSDTPTEVATKPSASTDEELLNSATAPATSTAQQPPATAQSPAAQPKSHYQQQLEAFANTPEYQALDSDEMRGEALKMFTDHYNRQQAAGLEKIKRQYGEAPNPLSGVTPGKVLGYGAAGGALLYGGDKLFNEAIPYGISEYKEDRDFNQAMERASAYNELADFRNQANHRRMMELVNAERDRQMLFATAQAGVTGQQRQHAYDTALLNAAYR